MTNRSFPDWQSFAYKYQGREEDEAEDEMASDSDLMGIRQAVLEGKNLRDADFVKKFEKQGCMFTAMPFEYTHTTLPKTVRMHAEFKGNPKIFEVSLVKYLETVGIESKVEAATISKDESLKLLSRFWNKARDIFYQVKREKG